MFGVRDARSVKRDCRAIGNLEVEIGSRPRQHATVLHNIAFCESGYVNRPALALRYGIEGRRIDCVAGHSRNGGRPSRERVGVFGGLGLCRRCAAISGRLTVLDRAGCDHHALDDPRNRVAALRLRELRRVGGIARNRPNRRRPASERVLIFRRRFLSRRRTGVCRRRTVLDRAGLNRRALDYPRNRVAALRRVELRRVGRVARHGGDSWRPAGECVGVFCRLGLGRRHAAVSGNAAVCNSRSGDSTSAIDIRPRNRVATFGGVELRRVGGCAGDGDDIAPASECVVIFRSRFLHRRCAAVGRRRAVCNQA